MNISNEMIDFFLEMLQTNKSYQSALKFMCTATVPKNLFLQKYKQLEPIESFNAETKKEWKLFVNEVFPGTPPEFRLEAVKIIYTIGILSN